MRSGLRVRGRPAAAAFVVVVLVSAALMATPVRAAPIPFSLRIAPSRYQVAIPRQRILALVSIKDTNPAAPPVALSARATNAWVGMRATSVAAGEVVEVVIVPRAPGSVHVTVSGTRRGLTRHRSIDIDVWKGRDRLRSYATQLRGRFIAWLAAERPDLGIESTTTWHPTIVWPYLLEVSHYLFFTKGWEMGLAWHVMIPPYDWTTIYLRARGALMPTLAFQIDSVSDPGAVPHAVAPPPEVMR